MSSALLVSEMGNVELLKTYPACYRCTVDLDASAVGWVASLWKSKKGRKHDELQGILRRGDEVLDTLHGRCACTHFCKQLALPCGRSFYFQERTFGQYSARHFTAFMAGRLACLLSGSFVSMRSCSLCCRRHGVYR